MVFDGRPSGDDFEDAVKDALNEVEEVSVSRLASVSSNLIDQRSWINAEGNAIQAAVKKADDSTVTFLMRNGKTVDYPVEKLSEESREIIGQALKDSVEEED